MSGDRGLAMDAERIYTVLLDVKAGIGRLEGLQEAGTKALEAHTEDDHRNFNEIEATLQALNAKIATIEPKVAGITKFGATILSLIVSIISAVAAAVLV